MLDACECVPLSLFECIELPVQPDVPSGYLEYQHFKCEEKIGGGFIIGFADRWFLILEDCGGHIRRNGAYGGGKYETRFRRLYYQAID